MPAEAHSLDGAESAGLPVPALALGTVQFGLAYGIAGATARVTDDEARAILAAAHARGVRVLDTAPGYGDIETRLASLIPAGAHFEIVSKIAALPPELLSADAAAADLQTHLTRAMDLSAQRLRSGLTTLLFHRAEDLTSVQGARVWEIARRHADKRGLRLGLSLYDVAQLPAGCEPREIDAVQCPANVFDQRLLEAQAARCVPAEVHVRSALLQGLLLMEPDAVRRRLPRAAAAVRAWRSWCESHSRKPMDAALGFVKSLPAKLCVFGVDSLAQFEELCDRWQEAEPMRAPELALVDADITDPRLWQAERS